MFLALHSARLAVLPGPPETLGIEPGSAARPAPSHFLRGHSAAFGILGDSAPLVGPGRRIFEWRAGWGAIPRPAQICCAFGAGSLVAVYQQRDLERGGQSPRAPGSTSDKREEAGRAALTVPALPRCPCPCPGPLSWAVQLAPVALPASRPARSPGPRAQPGGALGVRPRWCTQGPAEPPSPHAGTFPTAGVRPMLGDS